jgi:uncharacterized membrane protein
MKPATRQTTAVQVQTSAIFSGPLPPPASLEAYERILPGAAERILKMAEDEAVHRRARTDDAGRIDAADRRAYRQEVLRGQLFGFGIGLAAIAAAVYAGTHGAVGVGIVIGGGCLVGLVTAFLATRKN